MNLQLLASSFLDKYKVPPLVSKAPQCFSIRAPQIPEPSNTITPSVPKVYKAMLWTLKDSALFFLGVVLASFASGLIMTVVHRVTGRRDGQPDWLTQDLDEGKLDLFYLVTAAIAAVNLFYFVACSRWYRFKMADVHVNAGNDVQLD